MLSLIGTNRSELSGIMFRLVTLLIAYLHGTQGWISLPSLATGYKAHSSSAPAKAASTSWFATDDAATATTATMSLDKQKVALLQLGAALDRGQSYNPTSGAYVSPLKRE